MNFFIANEKNKQQINRKYKKGQLYKVAKGIYVKEPKDIFVYLGEIMKELKIEGTLFFKSSLEYKDRISEREVFILTKNSKSNIVLGEEKDLILNFVKETKSVNLKSSLLNRMNDSSLFVPNSKYGYLIQFSKSTILSKRANPNLACELMTNEVLSIYKDIKYVKYFIAELQSFAKRENMEENFLLLADYYRKYLRENFKDFDEKRISMFTSLKEALELKEFNHYEKANKNILFYEAYFSNYIEGTEFEIDEAKKIIFDPKHIYTRHKDGHDIINTYNILKEIYEQPMKFNTYEDFTHSLKETHIKLMGHRSDDILVGEFKKKVNISGSMKFVLPSLVNMTLKKGFELYGQLEDPVKKAIFMHIMLAEIHPFDDGNGRISRIFMNNELSKENLCHIIIPTVFREDYITALKGFSHQNKPNAIINSLIKAYKITNQINWSKDLFDITEFIKDNSGFEKDVNSVWGTSPEGYKEDKKEESEIPDFF